jgi:hypothetical protein
MFYNWRIVGCMALQLAVAGVGAAQEGREAVELPDAPVARLVSSSISSQDSEKQGSPAGARQENAPQKRETRFQSTIELLGRRSIFFPDLATTTKPLSVRQKLELFADKSVAPSRILSSLAGSGISQAANTLPGYGQGGDGYAKRFGSSMASEASNHFFGTFLIPSMLHDDPRYFVKLHASLSGRVGYALSRMVVIRKDNGESAANWPGMIAPLLAESLANSYLPTNERTTGRTFRRYGVRLGLTAVGNLAKEYWPTIFRSLRITRSAPSEGKS